MESLEIREKVWDRIIEILEQVEGQNQRAVIVQKYIAEGGPIPDSRGDKVRQLLKEANAL